MANHTKERFVDAALTMFSQKGYEGANILELSQALGLTKSAFYKHYASKEEVWNTVLDEMEKYYGKNFAPEGDPGTLPASGEELRELTKRLVEFTINDTRVVMCRKLIQTEQFRNERVRALATKHFNTMPQAMFTSIFDGMMKNGVLRQGDPAMLAFVYSAPISSMVQLCDREPERKAEILKKIDAFTDHFLSVYGE